MEKGLTEQEAKTLLQTYGINAIEATYKLSAISIFLSQFPTFINAVLTAAAIFAFIFGDQFDGVFIFAILFLNATFGFIQEYKSEKSLEKLKALIKPVSRVIRNTKEIELPTEQLVPGDVVVLSEGDRIPADGKITHGFHAEVDESILTGESLPVIKQKDGKLFKGTLLLRGKIHMLVEQTGMSTKLGQIAKTLVSIEADKTPLQIRLDTLGKMLSIIAFAIAIFIVPIGLAQGKTLVPLVFLAVSIGVAAIPEGLPAVITIALAIGTNRMAKKQAIVRKMPAVETLGAVQVILFDKTGTLTQNAMRVKKYWAINEKAAHELIRGCILGNTASLVQKEDGDDPLLSWDVIGDKTDGALLLFANQEKQKLTLPDVNKVLDEYVFDPATKTITTVVENDGKLHAYVRGAPEVILAKSTLHSSEKKRIEEMFQTYAKEGLRVIGFAKKDLNKPTKDRNHIENDLVFVGFIGIYDPPRPEAIRAVQKAKTAGIRPVMVTGDNEFTALTIAEEVGLIEKGEDVITGEELRKLSDEQLRQMLEKTRVFARTTPEDKLRLVNAYKTLGYVVGVTGDGVNDALALKRADVGIAMGDTGTDVAKEAADIVLTNDNFATIVHAVEEGRRIYNNILKSITYLLSGNLSELSLVLFATVAGFPMPLLPTQILWINIVTDGLPALALASDTKDADLLNRQPRNPKAPFLSGQRLTSIAVIGFGLSAALLLLFWLLLQITTEGFARTIIFNMLVISHLFITLLIRGSLLRPSRLLIFAILGTLAMQALITTQPLLQNIFHLGF